MQRLSLTDVRIIFLQLVALVVVLIWLLLGSHLFAQQRKVVDLDPAPLPTVPKLPELPDTPSLAPKSPSPRPVSPSVPPASPSLPPAPTVSTPMPMPDSRSTEPKNPMGELPQPRIPTIASPVPVPIPGPISEIPVVTPPDYVPLREYPNPLLRTTVTLEYLNWWVKAQTISSPLVTSGPLSQTGVNVLYTNHEANDFERGFRERIVGQGDIDFGSLSGVRFGLTRWTDSQKVFGFQTSTFVFEKGTERAAFSGGDLGTLLIARPFFNTRTDSESALYISNPALGITGSLLTESTLRFNGVELNGLYRTSLGDLPHYSYVFVGLRTLGLNETLGVAHVSRPILGTTGGPSYLGVPLNANEAVLSYDRLQTQNRFYGTQVGLRWQYTADRFTMGLTGKIGIGMNQTIIENTGETGLYRNGVGIANTAGGFFTVGDNRRRSFEVTFGYVPELMFDVMWEVAPNFRLRLGYNFLYWAAVVRPANVYERAVNGALIPSSPEFGLTGGGSRPASVARQTDFWAHGLVLGIEWRF